MKEKQRRNEGEKGTKEDTEKDHNRDAQCPKGSIHAGTP